MAPPLDSERVRLKKQGKVEKDMADKWALMWEQTDQNGDKREDKKVFGSKGEMEEFINKKENGKKIADQMYPNIDMEFRIKKKGKLNEVV